MTLWHSSELIKAIREAPRCYIIGNGGSYANAVHICNDLLACGVKAYTLDPATLTASANDYGYETVFSRWISTVGEPGDLLIAMSGSGMSMNILKAISAAEFCGMKVYRIFGNERSENMQAAEEAQIAIGHEVMRCLRKI
jgi:D-sedoheptulose 7-phosphate isomerase